MYDSLNSIFTWRLATNVNLAPCLTRNPHSYEDKDLCRLFDPAIAKSDVSAGPSTITACRWSWHHGSEGRNAEKLMGECMKEDDRTIVLEEGRGAMAV